MEKKSVAIIMGSKSDESKVKPVVDMLEKLEISYSWNIFSAHRTPVELADFVQQVDENDDYKVIIAAAGMSAALPGVIAAQTVKPVIGLPLSGSVLDGMDAVFSMIQMPPGIPVATVGINAAVNAALQAASIISLSDLDVREALNNYRAEKKEGVLKSDKELMESI